MDHPVPFKTFQIESVWYVYRHTNTCAQGPIIGVLPNEYSILSKEVKLGFVSALTLSHVHFYWLNPWFTLLPNRQCVFFNQVITTINPNLRKVGKYYYCWLICCPVSICSPNVFLIDHSFWINSKPLVAKLINVMLYVTFY